MGFIIAEGYDAELNSPGYGGAEPGESLFCFIIKERKLCGSFSLQWQNYWVISTSKCYVMYILLEMEFDALEREEMEVSENHPEVQLLLREVCYLII